MPRPDAGQEESVLPEVVERWLSQEGVGSSGMLEPAPTNLRWLITSLRKPIACISSQFQVQRSQVSRLTLAMMGVFVPWKLIEAKIRAAFFSPQRASY